MLIRSSVDFVLGEQATIGVIMDSEYGQAAWRLSIIFVGVLWMLGVWLWEGCMSRSGGRAEVWLLLMVRVMSLHKVNINY